MNRILTLLTSLYIFSLYLFDSGGSYLYISYSVGFLLFLILAYEIYQSRTFTFDRILIYLLAFIAWTAIGMIAAHSPARVLNRIVLMTFNAAMLFMFLNYLDSIEKIKRMLYAFISSGTFLSLYLLLNSNLSYRIGRIVGNANRIGNLLAFAFVMAVYFVFVEKRSLFTPAVFLIGTAAMLSGSRQAFLFIATALVILLALRFRKGRKNHIRLALLLVGMSIAGVLLLHYVPAIHNVLGKRLELLLAYIVTGETDASSINTRMVMIQFGLSVFTDRPILGFGLDNYKYLYEALDRARYAHNNYIELLVGTGLVGLGLYYSMFARAIRKSIEQIKNHQPLAELFLSMLIGLLVLANFSVYYAYKTIFVILAMIIALARLDSTDDRITLSEGDTP